MFVENHTAFFADFGVPVTLGGQAATAVFDNAYQAGGAGQWGIATTGPRLTLATAQVPANPVGQAAVVASASYVVVAHEPDGTGISVLLLEAAA